MGEAKRRAAERRQAQREEFLEEVERWSFPPSTWEAEVVAAIKALPTVTVFRPPPHMVAWAKMPPRRCFDNSDWYARQDPSRSKAVVGWLPDDVGNYTLHAVVRLLDSGEWQDWTPVVGDTRKNFSFIPDPHILQTKHDLGDRIRYVHERNGQEIRYGVRSAPERTIHHSARIKAALLAGMEPLEAVQLPYEP